MYLSRVVDVLWTCVVSQLPSCCLLLQVQGTDTTTTPTALLSLPLHVQAPPVLTVPAPSTQNNSCLLSTAQHTRKMTSLPYGLQAMLKEGHKHFSGVEEAVMKNIEACKALSQITRTSMGPNGGCMQQIFTAGSFG